MSDGSCCLDSQNGPISCPNCDLLSNIVCLLRVALPRSLSKSLKKIFVYLAVSDLSCSTQGLCLIMQNLLLRCTDSSCGTQAQLPHGTWDLNSLTRDQTHVPCIARRILSYWTTREILNKSFLKSQNLFIFLATREC